MRTLFSRSLACLLALCLLIGGALTASAASRTPAELSEAIAALPSPISLAEMNTVNALKEEVDALSDEDRAAVEGLETLTDAVAKLTEWTQTVQWPEDDPFTYQCNHKYALFVMTEPHHGGGQEFTPDFSLLGTVVMYIQSAAGNTFTLKVYEDTPTEDTEPLYTESFSFEKALDGFVRFDLSDPVPVEPHERYAVVITSAERSVCFGELSTAESGDFCLAINFDDESQGYNGWGRERHSLGFQVLGSELAEWQRVMLVIRDLPEEITLRDENRVKTIRQQFDALSAEEQALVTNADKLVAAEARIEQIKKDQEAAAAEQQRKDRIAAVQAVIDALPQPEEITLEDREKLIAAEQEVNGLKAEYGEEAVEELDRDALTGGIDAYNRLAMAADYPVGDINDDGAINASDALMALQHSVKLLTLDGDAARRADVNADGAINASDALLILQYSVKLIDRFDVTFPEVIPLETERNKALFRATYQSMFDRTEENGYARTSINGVYPGMFVRDSSIQILAHVACGDYDQAGRVLGYILQYHKEYGYTYALHIMGQNTRPLSDKVQADATFFLLRAWCQFALNAPETDETRALLNDYTDLIRAFAAYYFDNGYYNEELQLIRNPSLEHSRDGSYFNAYDLLTNVQASEALHELAEVFAKKDPEQAAKWAAQADAIAAGIREHLTAEVDGKRVYAEMQSIDKIGGYGMRTEDDTFYVGFSWVNMAPASGWYAMDPELMQNTYDAYMEYGSMKYYRKTRMLDAVSTYRPDTGKSRIDGYHVIGKGLAWEILYCWQTGKFDRVRELVAFVEDNSKEMYRETWAFSGGGGDTANQEHANWMIIAMQTVAKLADGFTPEAPGEDA